MEVPAKSARRCEASTHRYVVDQHGAGSAGGNTQGYDLWQVINLFV